MKAQGKFISFVLIVDTFLIGYAYGFNSRKVLIVDPKLPPFVAKPVPVPAPARAPAPTPASAPTSKPAKKSPENTQLGTSAKGSDQSKKPSGNTTQAKKSSASGQHKTVKKTEKTEKTDTRTRSPSHKG